MSSRREAWAEWKGVCILSARLASRESDIVAAAARADASAEPLVPDELRAFVVQQIAAERDGWQRGDPTSIAALFQSKFDRPEGRYRIFTRRDPLVRLVWASKRAADGSWRVVVLLWLELVTVGRSWRFYKRYSIESGCWTLIREGESWSVDRVESAVDGRHYLTDPLPDHGSGQELHDEATISTAVEDVAPGELPVAELTDVDASTKSQLLDLSLVDGRFAPDAIAACVCEIARVWESATFARDRRVLERWCTPEAATQLFHPTPHGLRRVLNLETRRVQINALHPDPEPPTVSVTLELHGQRWLATDRGGKISGSRTRQREFTEHWTLRLDPSTESPWRLIDVQDPGRR
jgi:hypothetical protein